MLYVLYLFQFSVTYSEYKSDETKTLFLFQKKVNWTNTSAFYVSACGRSVNFKWFIDRSILLNILRLYHKP